MTNASDTLLRVEKGNAAPEELAAITAILLARAAATPEETTARLPRQAGWRRLERTPGFRAPHSWQG
ncbi:MULTISPECIES: acyl-CoA carboxylase subunit epsilon [unclassified Streptomyces]|uniref:acyl-CoA carboxylase subunit epsilon n=1 Tax=unclassified Streptomyces TaxID=2593676 RepID=UPI0004519B94|nr:acyl-CoA carboxylase subunit epsilon [Streptomyces sp. PCS3-D2]WKV71687.1 acyl-CoA carboxylase subunit epsilon [Streptomyces sp. PCS3-D2]